MAVRKAVLTGLASLTLLDLSAEPASAQNWQGFYAGLDVGQRHGALDLRAPGFQFTPPFFFQTVAIPAHSEDYKTRKVMGGAHIGFNYLVQPSWFAGIEADFLAGSSGDTETATFISTDGVTVRTSKVRLGSQATLRGRLGYATGPWLIYATAGVAFARVTWSETVAANPNAQQAPTVTFSAREGDTRTGWAAGGGAAYAVNSNFSVRAQYLYEDFGKLTVPLAATSLTGRLSITAYKVTFGGSYRF